MHSFITVVDNSQIIIRPRNRPNCSVNKTKTIPQRWPSLWDNLGIGLQCCWVQHCRIPIDNSMAMDCIDVIKHFVGYHAQNRDRTSEAWYHITIPARVSKASSQHTKGFCALGFASLITVNPVWDLECLCECRYISLLHSKFRKALITFHII